LIQFKLFQKRLIFYELNIIKNSFLKNKFIVCNNQQKIARCVTFVGELRGDLGASEIFLVDDLNLESQNNSPDEAEGERAVSVYDIMGADILQVNMLLLEEQQRLVDILQAVNPHFAAGGPGQSLRGQDLEQTEQHAAISQVNVEIRDAVLVGIA